MEITEKKKALFLNLYNMVLADGIVHPKEMEMLYKMGTKTYGLKQEEIIENVKQAGVSPTIPELPEERIGVLYEMALVAWSDGELVNEERDLLRRYALNYGVKAESIDGLVDFLLEKAKENTSKEDVISELNT